MKKKTIKHLFLAFASLLLVVGGVCCKNGEETSDDLDTDVSVMQPAEETKLTVKNADLQLLIGDEEYLNVAYDFARNDTLSFESSNADVLSVDDQGKCTAKRVGTAVVTVKYGEEVATAQISVGIGERIPVLTFDCIKDGKIKVAQLEAFEFTPYVSFNGKKFDADTITYTLSDPTIGRMEGNVFQPEKVGKTTMKAVAQWAGAQSVMLTQTFEVEVSTNVALYINDGSQNEFTLYAIPEFCGNDYVTETAFSVQAFENGEALNAQVEIVAGEDVVEYDATEKVIRSMGKKGVAEILISCTDSQNETYEKSFKVTVLPSIAEYAGATLEFETEIGELPIETIFGENVTLAGAEENGKTLEILDNKVFGVTPVQDEANKSTITVYTESYGYVVPIVAYSRIIRSVADLEEIFRITEIETEMDGTRERVKSATTFGGYYVLAGNIDASGYIHRVTDNTIAENETETSVAYKDGNRVRSKLNKISAESPLEIKGGGLTGTFDGRGYTIFDLTVEDHGLFGLIYGGTVKNVGFSNVTLRGSTYQENKALFAEQSLNGTFKDVYITANTIYGAESLEDVRTDNDARGSRALLAVSAFGKTSVKDSFFTYQIASTTVKYCYSYGLFAYEGSMKNATGSSLVFENVYVVTNSVLISSNLAKIYKTVNSNVLLATNDIKSGATNEEIENRIYEIVGRPNHDNNMPWYSEGDDFEQYNGRTFLSHLCKQASGVYRYATQEEMLEAGHDFSHFSKYWVVLDGYLPCFESTGLEPAREVDGEYLFDTQVGEFTDAQLTSIFGRADVIIQSAKIGTHALTVGENNVINGFPIDKHGDKLSVIFKLQGEALGYKATVIPVTEYLDDIDDIARIFKITQATMSTDSYIESATSFDGYYVLAKDIDASGYTHQVATGAVRDNLKSLSLAGAKAHNGGLKGIFDGNGYTISNLTVGHHGLFGVIYGGTVKNVAFTNVTLKGDTNEENISLLAEQMVNGTLENVYIQANELIGGNGTTNSVQSRGNRSLLVTMAYGRTTMENCIFQYDIEGTQKQYARSYGLIAYESSAKYNTNYPLGSSVSFSNVYVISNAMISSWNPSAVYKNNSTIALGENETNETGLTLAQWREVRRAYVYEQLGGASNTNITETTITGERISRYTGMYRYATAKDMQDANNDYSAFENDYWTVAEGQIPVWKK
ncbi:MAG: hypothetical protein E7357_01940 [Clostridiales bacterium]|nr:hypothetical protein [Clostridiales bacterium]